ncbi:MAG: M15 family metallopeptidase [Flavobacteriaceae bacterium]|nr:M15 family metallopeptidase [Flavobacteriaceae bacterium]
MKSITLIVLLFVSSLLHTQEIPDNFVYIGDIDPTIKVELRYYSTNNFIGKKIEGYNNNCLLVTKKTALALKEVQKILALKGLSLKIFDAYRPQQAVNHFVKWAKDINDTIMKAQYYPNVPKKELFKRGYIAAKSGHSRGSTVDLTIVDLTTKKELDMGSPYDFFGEESHPFYKNISKEQKDNRMYLREIMLLNGFVPYDNEWWHFTLANEPFPKTYFNFPVE